MKLKVAYGTVTSAARERSLHHPTGTSSSHGTFFRRRSGGMQTKATLRNSSGKCRPQREVTFQRESLSCKRAVATSR